MDLLKIPLATKNRAYMEFDEKGYIVSSIKREKHGDNVELDSIIYLMKEDGTVIALVNMDNRSEFLFNRECYDRIAKALAYAYNYRKAKFYRMWNEKDGTHIVHLVYMADDFGVLVTD